jgi:opacity protein-like surface antigen
MNRKLGAGGLLLAVIACSNVYGGDFKPFVGMELVAAQPDTPIGQRDTLLNIGIDYKMGPGLSGGIDVGLREDNAQELNNSAVSLKTNLYAKYDLFTESWMSPFIMAGYTTARFDQKNCAHNVLEKGNVSLPAANCEAAHLNTFGSTYGIGMTFKGNRRNSSVVMLKYLKTTGMADFEMDSLGVSFIY